MNSTIFYLSILVMFIFSANKTKVVAQSPYPSFDSIAKPLVPNYSSLKNWAAHPQKKDLADLIPRPLKNKTTELKDSIDVFFVHPTIYTNSPENEYGWNADIHDDKMNKKIDDTTIKLQASIFNQAGRLFSPRYRQAHLRSFFQPNIMEGNKALDLAYQDVKAAFLYYMKNENNGRPIIFAGHSQGARHIKQLLKELFDGTELQKQLVAAYIVGWGVHKDYFEHIPLGKKEEQTGCFLTWRTYTKGYTPNWIDKNDVCVNPLNWQTDTSYAPYQTNKGTVIYNLNKIRKKLFDAQVQGPVLWVGVPNIIFGKLIMRENYHAGDLNLFYVNVRQNAIKRARAYLATKK